MGIFLQDVKYALRTLRNSPSLTAAALLTLAIGIGANTAMFSLVDGVLLRPFPYPDPERLVFIWDSNPGQGWDRFSVSPPNFIDYRDQATVFDSMSAYYSTTVTLTGVDEPERIPAARVGPDYFQTFGIAPQIGRAFAPEDNEPGNTGVVILSDRLWARRFASDPAILGRQITIDGYPATIVGVFTERTDAPAAADMWLPEDLSEDNLGGRGAHYFAVVARLAPGIGLERANDDIRQIAERLAAEYPDSNFGWTALVSSLHEDRVGGARGSLMVLTAAVALVLLIACANIANLLLARATHRDREIALRVALGAGRGRIFAQVLSESVVMALIGGGLGIAVAAGIMGAVTRLAPGSLPRLDQVGIDGRVLGFTLIVSAATGLLFGMVPAAQSARADLVQSLKERSRTGRPGRNGVRGALVVAEVALALVVVAGAGLLARSLWQLQAVDPGFSIHNRVTARISLPGALYPELERRIQFFDQLTERVSGLPGVTAVGLASGLPMGGYNFIISFTVEGRPDPPPDQEPSGHLRIVSPGYFEAIGLPLLQGRDFNDSDRRDSGPAVVISKRLADLHFPEGDPIGQRLRIGYGASRDDDRVREIVGIVGDARLGGLSVDPLPAYYLTYRQLPESAMDIVVSAAGNATATIAALRREVSALDADIPVYQVQTLEERVLDSAAPQQFRAALVGSFAAVALLLACVGIYGVMAYSVAQRTRELGIRLALGADRGTVLGLVLRRGLALAGMGIALGLVISAGANRFLASLLFGVAPTDPLTYAAVAALLLAVSLLACYLPARRATRVDPTVAMRAE